MNDLLKIETREGRETVNARELHEFLEVGKDFSTWIKDRIEKYSFTLGLDFITEVFPNSGEKGGRPQIQYFLSLDMAKELSMVENNSKGREARLYFIEVEKRAREFANGPGLLARAVLEASKMIEGQTKLIAEMKPKAAFYDAVTGSKDAIDLGQAAKVLAIPGFGRNNLFELLRQSGVLMNDNLPYQTYVDRGYFRVIESSYTKPDGSTHVNLKTVVYQRGLDAIRKIVEKNHASERSLVGAAK